MRNKGSIGSANFVTMVAVIISIAVEECVKTANDYQKDLSS